MTILDINLNDVASGRQRSFIVDTDDAMGRLWGRWLVRSLPGNFELARHFYPDDELVIERLGNQYDPLTVTRCKGGVPNLICPRKSIGEWDQFVRLTSDAKADYFAAEDERARLFTVCADRMEAAFEFLDPANESFPTSVDDAKEKQAALRQCLGEVDGLGQVLGPAWNSDIHRYMRVLFRKYCPES